MFRRTNHLQITCLLSFASGIALSHSAPADEIHVPDDYPKISTAISEADDGDVIIVHPGDYPEHINFLGKPITVRSTDPTDPYVVMNTRIIGYYESDLVTCENDEGPDTVLAGFTITHENPDDMGCGMYNEHADPTVQYCIFSEISASRGAGMRNYYSSPNVSHCEFYQCYATSGGGGMYNADSTVTVTDCTFLANFSGSRGGGMYNLNSDVTVTGCVFDQNLSYENGGGMYQSSGTLSMTDCEFNLNNSDENGGGMYFKNCSPTLTDCTFTGNDSPNWDSVAGENWSVNSIGPPVTGACCLPGGVCMVGAESDCIEAGGDYMDDGTDCETADCPEPCPGDVDNDGDVDTADLLALLGAWGACP
jgi:hypothetical protein